MLSLIVIGIALLCFFLLIYIENQIESQVDKRYKLRTIQIEKQSTKVENKLQDVVKREILLDEKQLELSMQKKSLYEKISEFEKTIENKYRNMYLEKEERLCDSYKAYKDSKEKEFNEMYKKYTSSFRNMHEFFYSKKEEELENSYQKMIQQHRLDLEQLLKSKEESFPWLAGMISDYLMFDLMRAEEKLSESMSMKIADKYIKVSALTKQLKETQLQYYNLKYQQEYLLAAYPKLQEIIDTETSLLPSYSSDTENDPVQSYLSASEYASLPENDRNQHALDNYVSSHKKTSWQIGRDYELYVGYRMRTNHFKVNQTGISDKFEDLGRDIIATKNGIHYIVQCKYWSADKVIREKHIAQLYGTGVCYALEHGLPLDKVRCVFYTNIDYSDMAKQFAEALSVKLIDHFELGDYPRIKCKVNYDEYGKTYIYHLPMDQQYDTTIINPDKGDMYAFTVEEAVSHGFRRAYRWHGN